MRGTVTGPGGEPAAAADPGVGTPPPAAPKLFGELAAWWPLLTAPAEYAEEAAAYARTFGALSDRPPRTLLELGSGGGNNASHLKARFAMVLVDRSPEMLAVSRALNPECEHVQADMRTVRLGRAFDCVFAHDALSYMTTGAELREVMETAFAHCRPGGVALFVPDHLRENLCVSTEHGGYDGADGRGLRYLMWTWDPDPADDTYVLDFAYLLREPDGSARVEYDRHVNGLFSRAAWLRLLAEVGFEPRVIPFAHSENEHGTELFCARRPG